MNVKRISRAGATAGIILALGILSMPAPRALAQDESPTISFELDRVEGVHLRTEEAPERAILVRGQVDLPDRAIVNLTVHFEGERGPTERVTVQDGTFEHDFPVEGRVLPGTYRIEVSYRPDDQGRSVRRSIPEGTTIEGAEEELVVGTTDDIRRERARYRQRVLEVLENLRSIHADLIQEGSFTKSKAIFFVVRDTGQGSSGITDRSARDIENDWETFTRDVWNPSFSTIRYDLRETREYVFMPYFPEALGGLVRVTTMMAKLYASYTRVIFEQIGVEVPDPIAREGALPPGELRGEVQNGARAVYRELEAEPRSWEMIDLSRPERMADVQGDLFRSTVSYFEVEKPGDAWTFDVTPVRPTVRLRIRPTEEEARDRIVSGVEIQDFPMAESFDDLAERALRFTQNAWPGVEIEDEEDLSVSDETMPNGERPGLALTFTFEGSGDTRYRVRQWSLFCRWHKRTYSVVSLTPAEEFEAWQEAFQEINETFAVLDAPGLMDEMAGGDEGDEGTEGTGSEPADDAEGDGS